VSEATELEYEPDGHDWAWLDDERERFESLSPEDQAHELNHASDLAGSRTVYVVVNGYVVNESGAMHREILERREPVLVGARRPSDVARVARARESRPRRRRSTRSSTRTGPARSSDDDDDDLARLGGRLATVRRRRG
jgi:hypothetical protein